MKKYDAIVLLGLKLRPDGAPEEELVARAERAAACYAQGLAPAVLACGGDTGAGVSEATVMKRLLMQFGVPGEAVVCEERSQITYENMKNAFALLGKDRRRVLLVTSDYHMPRARLTAWREGGIWPDGQAVKTRPGTQKRQRARIEFFATVDYLLGWGRRDAQRPAWAEAIKRFLLRKNGRA